MLLCDSVVLPTRLCRCLEGVVWVSQAISSLLELHKALHQGPRRLKHHPEVSYLTLTVTVAVTVNHGVNVAGVSRPAAYYHTVAHSVILIIEPDVSAVC